MAPPKKKPTSRTTKKKPTQKRRSVSLFLLKWLLILGVWAGIAGGIALAYFAHDLPDIDTLEAPQKKHSIIIRSADGVILANFGDLYGDALRFKQLPKTLVQALLATEDRRFFDHFGIDLQGLARAAYHNYHAGRVVEGGSTITQQLAKNLFLSSERTLKRKIQEAMLALQLENRFSKEQILALYLNRVYLGAGTFGVDAAAKRYFGKPATELNIMESAMIVGLLKAPSRFSPTNNPALAKARASQVIKNMQEAGYLDNAKEFKAASEPAQVVSYRAGSMGSYYFADWILEHLDDYVGSLDQDIEIQTTLDARLQREAEESLEEVVEKEMKAGGFSQAALVAMSPDGAIRAMVGGRDYRQSQFNRVTQAKRQPGSSFKLFDYLAALEHGAQPNDIWVDQPITIGNWSPGNYTQNYKGEMTLAEAFAQSINSIAIQVSEWAGREHVIEIAERLGVSSPILNTPSLALGSNEVTMLELAGAYAHLANQGRSVFPYGVDEIRTTEGKILYKRMDAGRGRVLPSHVVMAMNSMLMGVVEMGTGRAAQLGGMQVAGKTGTSQEYRDAWFTGFTSHLLASVWVGNDDGTYMKKVTGGSVPSRLWKNFMLKAHKEPMPEFMKARATLAVDDEPLLPWQNQQPSEELPWQQVGGQQGESAPAAIAPASPFYDPTVPPAPPSPPADNAGSIPVYRHIPPAKGNPPNFEAPNAEAPNFEDIIRTPITPSPRGQ